MKWFEAPEPKREEKRERCGFLWYPKRIDREWRWLEFAAWIETYIYVYHKVGDCGERWVATEWINK